MQSLQHDPRHDSYRQPTSPAPVVALAALVAVLHLSVLAGRLGRGALPGSCDALAWRIPAAGPTDEPPCDQSPSNPTCSYSFGQLALNTGIAVVALTVWLRVMRMNGTRWR